MTLFVEKSIAFAVRKVSIDLFSRGCNCLLVDYVPVHVIFAILSFYKFAQERWANNSTSRLAKIVYRPTEKSLQSIVILFACIRRVSDIIETDCMLSCNLQFYWTRIKSFLNINRKLCKKFFQNFSIWEKNKIEKHYVCKCKQVNFKENFVSTEYLLELL